MKLIIIGAGPAGISASLYAKRGNIDTTIIHHHKTGMDKAHLIDNYYGLPNISGKKLYEIGIAQAQELGVNIIEDEIIGIEFNDGYQLSGQNATYHADAVIIASGAYRNSPTIKKIKDFEGKGVSYCATCDGFFYRNKNIGVIGNGAYAYHEASYLKNISPNVSIFLNGKEIEDQRLKEFTIIPNKIKEIDGDDYLNKLILDNDDIHNIDGLFIALGSIGSVDIAKKLGIESDNNRIIVDENMRTNIPGIYACGDCTKGMLQISKAVYEGALAATDAIKYLKNKNK